ncbi:hypothetical protein BV22DRAFT_509934 [Leucogyrophana mollusca]|uniref:Uncharacterized protein n=1 Tax=Leucogyrophana mollusca TaxID=85980 RepID=A0ACB8BEZ4_9AGAM|nr:hypothetical protein BV22DRAFT_509934 [Leucogyrophana mollusca]
MVSDRLSTIYRSWPRTMIRRRWPLNEPSSECRLVMPVHILSAGCIFAEVVQRAARCAIILTPPSPGLANGGAILDKMSNPALALARIVCSQRLMVCSEAWGYSFRCWFLLSALLVLGSHKMI